ncbi:unnamed protein product [Nezara viridula]|uniref:Progestin and adipoQ receptor family member 4 n=1 Tax=Nezara viridula TaxID=85310 RepID=A0A9P0HRH9_NEZVI|nr:unnamed protein product [Nezara viridula]
MKRLLRRGEVPPHLQFNPYVLAGYRPLLGLWGSLCSLCYLHNETVNILSHALAIVYILCVLQYELPWSEVDCHLLMYCHLAGTLCPWIGSFVYHLFMNMDRPPPFYYRLLQLDMLGIWVSQSFGALTMVCASVACLPKLVQWIVIASYSLLSLLGLFKAMAASSPWKRRMCFALPFLMRNCLVLLRLTKYGGGNPDGLLYVILQDLISLIGGAIGALNVPERWMPGSLDYCFNSHNIMHVLVVLAVYYMNLSTISDLLWLKNGQCQRSVEFNSTPHLHQEL